MTYSVIRWTFEDRSTGDTVKVPINPNQMSSPTLTRNMTWSWGSRWGQDRMRGMQTAPAAALEWTFQGVLFDEDHYDLLQTWSNRLKVIRITDHLLREFDVIIQKFDPVERRTTARFSWRADYTMTCLLLKQAVMGTNLLEAPTPAATTTAMLVLRLIPASVIAGGGAANLSLSVGGASDDFEPTSGGADDLTGYTSIGNPGADAQATLQAALNAHGKVALIDDGVHSTNWDCDASILFDSNMELYVDTPVNLWRNFNSSNATSAGFLKNRSWSSPVNNVKIWGHGNIAARNGKGGNILSFWANNFTSQDWRTTYYLRHTMIAGDNIYFGHHHWRVDETAGSGGAGLRFAGGDNFIGEYLNVISGDDVFQCVPAGAPSDPLWNVSDTNGGVYRHCVGRSQSARLCVVGLQDSNTGGTVALGMNVSIDGFKFQDIQGFGGGTAINVANHSSTGTITNIKFDGVLADQRDTESPTHGQPGETFVQVEGSGCGIVDSIDFDGSIFGMAGVTIYNKRTAKDLLHITDPFSKVSNVTTPFTHAGNLALDTETLT